MSKFKDIMTQARQREAESHDQSPDQLDDDAPKIKTARGKNSNSNGTAVMQDEPETPILRGRGRPVGHAGGKRSHPNYQQVSAYLPRQMHREIKLALLQNEIATGQKREFSTLVEDLLKEWLQNQSRSSK